MARRSACQSNLKQLGLALLNHESGKRKFPPVCQISATQLSDSFSAQAYMLPSMEQSSVANLIDFTKSFTLQPQVTATRIPLSITSPATGG